MDKKHIVIFLILISLRAYAQDTQLSQYYNAPLYLNPALAGAGLDTRIGTNYRLQWPSLANPYKSFSVWADHDFYKIRSGIGFMLRRDVQGPSNLASTELSALYSYQVNVSQKWTLKPAIQVGFINRSINFSNAVFGDQLSNDGANGNQTNDVIALERPSKFSPDISAGIVGYNANLWLGFSVHHINQPNMAFGIEDAPLPMKFSFIGGYKFVLLERQVAWGAPVKETSITPTFLYKSQGTSDQLDIGLYWIHNPVMAGLWYRGIPTKKYASNVRNSESMVMMVGLNHNGLTISYSYDLMLSKLSSLSGGAHEIALLYQWQTDKSNRKGKKGHRPMPCPNVDRQFKRSTF